MQNPIRSKPWVETENLREREREIIVIVIGKWLGIGLLAPVLFVFVCFGGLRNGGVTEIDS